MKSTPGRFKYCNVDAIIPDRVVNGSNGWTASGRGRWMPGDRRRGCKVSGGGGGEEARGIRRKC